MHYGLKRIRRGAIVSATTFVCGVLGYRMFGRGWVEAVNMNATTISTVGFTERSELAGSEQLFVVALIVVGISAAVYTLGGFLNMTATGDIERAWGVFRIRCRNDILAGRGSVRGQSPSSPLLGSGDAFFLRTRSVLA